jgi:hypothetical protein
VISIRIADLQPLAARLTGAVIGEHHASQVTEMIASAGRSGGEPVVLDFDGIESASASYLKRLLAPFLARPRSLVVAPTEDDLVPIVVTNVNGHDLIEDLDDFLEGKEMALVAAVAKRGTLQFDRIIGRLDQAASETFRELLILKEATAQALYERHPNRTTNQTAWNNRLAQLVQLGIARRRRVGRFWMYQPTVKPNET